jgi:hypothetical protein
MEASHNGKTCMFYSGNRTKSKKFVKIYKM